MNQSRCLAIRRNAVSLTTLGIVSSLVAALAACSSHGGASGDSQSSKSGSSTSSPIIVGAYYQGTGTQNAYPEVGPALQAAVQYVNNDLGGVGGHPLKLVTCVTDGTPTSTQNCAQELVSKKPAIVVNGYDQNDAVANKIIGGAGIVTVAESAGTLAADADPMVYYLSGSPGTVAVGLAASVLAVNPNAKHVAELVPDVPVFGSIVDTVKTVLADKGVELNVVKFPASSADLSQAWVSLRADKQDTVLLTVDPGHCLAAIKAAKLQQSRTPVISFPFCASADIVRQTGNATDGWLVQTASADPGGDDPDAVIYRAQMAKFDKNANAGGFAPQAFPVLMMAYEILKAAGYDKLSADSIRQAARAGGPIFMGGGQRFKCETDPAFPAICSFGLTLGKVSGDKYAIQSQYTVDTQELFDKYVKSK